MSIDKMKMACDRYNNAKMLYIYAYADSSLPIKDKCGIYMYSLVTMLMNIVIMNIIISEYGRMD